MAAASLTLVAALLLAGANAQATISGMMAPTPAPPSACTAGPTSVATGPQSFSTATYNNSARAFSTMCTSGTFLTAWNITPAISPLGPSSNRVYAVAGVCSDGSSTATIRLPTVPAGQCLANFTAGNVSYVPSDSTPKAYWNVYYRYDSFLDGLWGVGSFSGANSHPGVFGCPGNSYVVGFFGTVGCDGFSAFQLMCSNCAETLNQPPYNQPTQGSQGKPSSPQPALVCNANAPPNLVDAISGGAALANYTVATLPPKAPAPSPAGAASPPAQPPAPKAVQSFACQGTAYVTEFFITSERYPSGATRVSNISAYCSDYTYTPAVSIPSTCPAGSAATTVGVQSDSNPPAWWNVFIKTDGVLESFLNIGASLAIGSPQVVGCPNNTYVQGLETVAGCGGITSLQLICSSCGSALSGFGGPNSPDGATYKNGGFQSLRLYSSIGTLAGYNVTNATRNAGNTLPTSIQDGTAQDLLVSYPCSGANLYPNLPKAIQAGFIQGLLYVMNSTDPQAVPSYINDTLIGTTGRRLLQSNQTVNVNMKVSTSVAQSIAQLLTSEAGFQGLNTYFLTNGGQLGGITLSGTPTVRTYSAPSATQASNTTSSQACTGSHHFGHWCHTSISRGGIIAIIVIFSLIVLALLIGIPIAVLGLARRRRTGRPTGAATGATPWNDPAGTNANVSVANPASARK